MQLFITDFKQNWNDIIIANPEILEQTRKVLRMKIWDKFFVQKENTRHEIQILDRDKTTITSKILTTIDNKSLTVNCELWIVVSMPNKRTKAELIVQKLAEIWINNIYFRPSERSVLKERNDKKLERLEKISQEAVEQSRWREIPKIEFIKDISTIIQNKKVIIFDKVDVNAENSSPTGKLFCKTSWGLWNFLWIIGPEGWLTPKDYEKFGKNSEIISLWNTVLRMETASIIAWWIMKNLLAQ
jgi:16S rRNA (uracil1498-N3)-methyltransferase